MRETAIHNPSNTPQGLQQSPGDTRDFGANDQPRPQICSASSPSQVSPHAAFTQSRAICLSVPAPAGIIHLSVFSPLSQSGWEGYWAASDQDRDLLSLPRAACMGTGIHPTHRRLGYLVTALLPCGARHWSLLGKPQHRGSPRPLWDSNVPMAGAGRVRVQHVAELDPGPFPNHRHCLHLLSPAAFPALLRHSHPTARRTRHRLPGPWAPLKPSPGRVTCPLLPTEPFPCDSPPPPP